jgi:hypothetical protein
VRASAALTPRRGIGGAPIRTGVSLADGCGRSARTNSVWIGCVNTIAPRSESAIAAISAGVLPAIESGLASRTFGVEADQASAYPISGMYRGSIISITC